MPGIDDDGTSFMLSDEITKNSSLGQHGKNIDVQIIILLSGDSKIMKEDHIIIEPKMRIQYKILLTKSNKYKTKSKFSICGDNNMLLVFTWMICIIFHLCFISVFLR